MNQKNNSRVLIETSYNNSCYVGQSIDKFAVLASRAGFCIALGLAVGAGAQNFENSREIEAIDGQRIDLSTNIAEPPLGLPLQTLPQRNPATPLRIDLGRKLFYDRRLSFNRTLSCAMCHVPEQGFTQYEVRTPVGIEGRFVRRNAPSLLNVGYQISIFHDGRESTIENQVWQPLLNFNEMANPSIGFVLASLREAEDYEGLFEAAFEQGLTVETVGMALASYQRGLVSADSPFDRWYFGGNEAALDASAIRGWRLFQELTCVSCHTVEKDYALFSNGKFYDTGIGYARSMGIGKDAISIRLAPGVEVTPTVDFHRPRASDLGRYEVTGKTADRWRFRVPTLRNVAITAPYMHDGSLPDLEAVIDHYNAGGVPHESQDPRIHPLNLDDAAKADLLAFLKSLTGSNVAALVADGRSQQIGDGQ
ncbi:cytochrome-c peroxidase [Haliea sp. E17]